MAIVTVDMTAAAVQNVGTKVGSGNVLQDASDSTYFQLTGTSNLDSDATSAGWIIVTLPDLPDFDSLNSLSLTVRAEFNSISSATRASMMIALTGYDGSGVGSGDTDPFEVSQFYAYCIPGSNFPVTGTLPTGIQTYTFVLADWAPIFGSTVNEAVRQMVSDGGGYFVFNPRFYFGDPSGSRVQANVYEITLTFNYTIYTPPVFDPPPDLPDGYSDWAELDLSTAVFGTSIFSGLPFGRYDSARDRILTNTGWPDFWFPGFELDPLKDYYFQFVFDSNDSRHVTGWEDVYVWMLNPADPMTSYHSDPYLPIYEDDNYESGNDYHLFHVDSGSSNWSQLTDGFVLPAFETGRYGVLAKIRWAEFTGIVTPPVVTPALTRAHFWGQ